MREFTTIDKSTWGEGPWQDEPDKIVWVDDKTDLDCMIHRGTSGALCGYVGVPKGHPWYGVDYGSIDVRVHGGLTYSATCQEGGTEEDGVCHVPEEGRQHDIWWVGFDCAHFPDRMPRIERDLKEASARMQRDQDERLNKLIDEVAEAAGIAGWGEPHYWTVKEVTRQVLLLAAQASGTVT